MVSIGIYLNIQECCRQTCEGSHSCRQPIFQICTWHKPHCLQHCLARHRAILSWSPTSCSRSRQRFRFLVHVCLRSMFGSTPTCSSKSCGPAHCSLQQVVFPIFGRILQPRTNFFPLCWSSSTGLRFAPSFLDNGQHRRLRSWTDNLININIKINININIKWCATYLPSIYHFCRTFVHVLQNCNSQLVIILTLSMHEISESQQEEKKVQGHYHDDIWSWEL